tara:strand:- start:297 stop:2390 length:2094 start_codon:yes stop_codon:yes gene_type:complete
MRGDKFIVHSESKLINDAIVGIANNNTIPTTDKGIIMQNTTGNVAIIHHGAGDGFADQLTFGYTDDPLDTVTVTNDLTKELTVNVLGNVITQNNLSVGGTLKINNITAAAQHSLQAVTNVGNVTSNTVQFSNAITSLVASSNIVVTGNVSAGYDTNTTSYFGKAAVGHMGTSGQASFAHVSHNDPARYAIKQTAAGPTYINTPASGHIRFTVNDGNSGAEKMRITSAGKVGIGVSAPDATLHVVGNAYVSSNLIVSSNVQGGYDTNTTSYFGRAAVGYCGHGDAMSISHIDSNDTGGYALLQEANGATMLNSASGQPVHIRQGNVNKLTIDSDGKVGIGASSPIAALDIDGGPENDIVPALSIRGGQYTESDLYVLNSYNNSTVGGVGYAAKVIGVNIKNKLETDNKIQIRSNTGGLTCGSAMYLGTDDAISGVFGVLTGDGAAGTTLTERFTVRVNGRVGINKTNPDHILDVHSDDAIHIEQAGNTTFETKIHGGAVFIRNPSTSSGYEHFIINNHATGSHTTSYIQFRRGVPPAHPNGAAIGTISGNGSTISYGGQSDYRVKENIVPMPISGLDTINNLQPKRFNFIGYPDDIYDGFIAHELQEHIPMAVTGVKDEMRGRGNVVKIDDESVIVKEDVSEPDSLEEGTKWVKLSEEPVYQNVDLSKIVTYLVKAVQELSEENQTLKTRLDVLENAS